MLRFFRQSPKTQLPPEVEAIFERLNRLLNDEKMQIQRLPELLRVEVLRGADCDQIPGAVGEFGRDPRNPIPVNGPIGEVIYLSNLRTNQAQQIMFHRLGSISKLDVYETVAFDGTFWDILFLDFYHPRKSKRTPTNYRVVSGPEREPLFLGTNEFVANFPSELPSAIARTFKRITGIPMQPPKVREAIERFDYDRPSEHRSKLKAIVARLDGQLTVEQ
jgi:hypothetical protein